MTTENKAPWHIWAVGIAMLLWNIIGCMNFSMTHLYPDIWLVGFTDEQRAYFMSFPQWANIAWACGVFGGFLGAAMILLRKRFALPLYLLSLAGLLISNIFHLIYAESVDLIGGAPGIAFTGFLALIALFQIWYSRKMIAAGVLQ